MKNAISNRRPMDVGAPPKERVGNLSNVRAMTCLLLLTFLEGCQHCHPLSVGNLPAWVANFPGRPPRSLKKIERRGSMLQPPRRRKAAYIAGTVDIELLQDQQMRDAITA